MTIPSSDVLILPGWQGSGPTHWQTRWEATHGYRRVEQHDWQQPLRGDWIARLEDVVLDCPRPPLLVAHSLGCILVAAWASVSRHAGRVRGALLVAPGDVELEPIRFMLRGWTPIPLAPLPFASTLVASSNDPYCSLPRARQFAHAWGSRFIDHGPRGHINADAGLGDWPEGHALLQALASRPPNEET